MIRLTLSLLAIGALLKRLHRAETLAAELAGQRGEAWAEIGVVRRDLIQAIADRDLARDIAEEILRERDSLMLEVECLRGDEDPGLEMAN